MRCGRSIPIIGGNFPTMEEILYKIGVLLYSAVHSLIVFIYEVFYAIVTAKIFGEEQIKPVLEVITSILGIVTLFFVTFTLFKMLFDPNVKSESAKNGKQLVKDVFITVVLLISISFLFETARTVQNSILKENYIQRIFEPKSENSGDGTQSSEITSISDAGKGISIALLKSFYVPKAEVSSTELNTSETINFYTDESGSGPNGSTRPLTFDAVYDEVKKDGPDFLANLSCNDLKNKVTFYWPLLFGAGLFVIWALFVYSLDMGIRVAKLAFYQIIAPIPIALRIIPKQKVVFSRWLKNTVSTFIDVFLRLIFISSMIFMINIVANIDLSSTEIWDADVIALSAIVKNFAKAIIILGIISFLFKITKIFEDIFGKAEGTDLGLGYKKVKDRVDDVKKTYNAAKKVGRTVTNPLATANAGINQFKENYQNARLNGQSGASALASAFAGGAVAAYRANRNYAHGQRFSDAVANAEAEASANRDNRDARQNAINSLAQAEALKRRGAGATPNFGDIMRARAQAAFGTSRYKNQLALESAIIKKASEAGMSVKDLINSSPGIAQLQSAIANGQATLTANGAQYNAAQNDLANADRKISTAEEEKAKVNRMIEEANRAQENKNFGAETKEIDANGDVTTRERNFSTPEEAEKYIADERNRETEADKRAEEAKKIAHEKTRDRAVQQSKVDDLKQQLKNVNDEIAASGILPEKHEKAQKAADLQKQLDKEEQELRNIDTLIGDAEANSKKAENEAAVHKFNANKADYALANKDKIISDRNAVLTAPASGVGVKFRETTVDSLGAVTAEKTITGIADAQRYIADQQTQYEASRGKVATVGQEILDIKNENSRLETEIAEIDGKIANPNLSDNDRTDLVKQRNANVAELKGNNDLLSSKQSEYIKLDNEKDVFGNNASSASQALTSVLQQRTIGDISSSPVGYTVQTVDSSGSIISKTVSGVGADDAKNQIYTEKARIESLSNDLSGHRKTYSSAIEAKQEATQKIAASEATIQNLDNEIAALPDSDVRKIDKINERNDAVKQLKMAKTEQRKAEQTIDAEQGIIQTITSKIDVHRSNVSNISDSLNGLYKEKSIGTQSATITYTDTSVDGNGKVVQTQQQVFGVDTAKKVVQDTIVQRDQIKIEHETVKNTREKLIQEQVVRSNLISDYNTQLQTINKEIETARQDPTRQADVASLSSQYGVIKAKMDLEKGTYDGKTADVTNLNDQEARLSLQVDACDDKISSIGSSITQVIDDPNNHGDIATLTQRVQIATDKIAAAKEEKAKSEVIVEKYKGQEEYLKQQKAKLTTMYETVIKNNESIIIPQMETVNKEVRKIIQKRPELAAELRDTYGIDISTGDIQVKDIIEKKKIKKIDSAGNVREVNASIIDWLNDASTKLSKEAKNYEILSKKDKPKSENKPEKKDDGGK